MDEALVLLGLAAASLVASLERYRLTSHGPNPWTLEGLLNVIRLSSHFEAARAAIGGTYTSVFRSPSVNAAVGGVSTSDHLAGCATDIVPTGDVDVAAKKILELAHAGKIGPVRQVVREPTWVHIGWHRAGVQGPPQYVVKT